MKTIDLSSHPLSIAEILDMARKDHLLIKTGDGDSFIVGQADELALEVESPQRNHEFLSMLDKFKQDEETIPLGDAQDQLR